MTTSPRPLSAEIDDAGHFLHLEKPGEVSDHILTWVS
jgi:pimeloyl-ACP methyl ester carboxylesterase